MVQGCIGRKGKTEIWDYVPVGEKYVKKMGSLLFSSSQIPGVKEGSKLIFHLSAQKHLFSVWAAGSLGYRLIQPWSV
jgi:hypothetical protein